MFRAIIDRIMKKAEALAQKEDGKALRMIEMAADAALNFDRPAQKPDAK